MDLDIPKVMGILNITPDSFYALSRQTTYENIKQRVAKMVDDGVDIIDIGGCSTRPGFSPPSEEEEWHRVDLGCKVVKEISADIPISVDTLRASVARKAIQNWRVPIINDISGGADCDMWNVVSKEKVVYVLTHNNQNTDEIKDITSSVITDLSKKANELHRLGVNDIIIDPGFGFAKTVRQNFKLLAELEEISKMGFPVLVGVSRKSMIWETLKSDPENALAGTIALQTIALEKGAHILRVHDVKEAVEIIKLYTKLRESAL